MSLSLSPQYRSWNFRKAHGTCRYLLSPCRVSLRQLMSPCQILQKTPCRHFDSRGNANCTTCIYYCHLSIVIYLDKRGVLQIEYSQPTILPSPHFRWAVMHQEYCWVIKINPHAPRAVLFTTAIYTSLLTDRFLSFQDPTFHPRPAGAAAPEIRRIYNPGESIHNRGDIRDSTYLRP